LPQNIPQTPTWYDIPVPAIPESAAPLAPLPPAKLSALQSRANTLLESLHNPKSKLTIGGGKSSSDNAFLSQILSDGTHQDKLSALILLVRESPIHRMAELERLRSMAGWSATGAGGGGIKGGGGREEKIAVMRALSDWWVAGGGKEQGKLR
jgi:ribosome biogenesis protein MAK21